MAMNYLIQFSLPHPLNEYRFLAPNNTVTNNPTEALIFPTAQTAGIWLDNYIEDTEDTEDKFKHYAIIRPTGL